MLYSLYSFRENGLIFRNQNEHVFNILKNFSLKKYFKIIKMSEIELQLLTKCIFLLFYIINFKIIQSLESRKKKLKSKWIDWIVATVNMTSVLHAVSLFLYIINMTYVGKMSLSYMNIKALQHTQRIRMLVHSTLYV